ncbi:MAG: hypothetical protein LBS33_06025, partial [Streptococcaceae bacterium]|nr:hypothetical protein [Streptococcaceae bacterium]
TVFDRKHISLSTSSLIQVRAMRKYHYQNQFVLAPDCLNQELTQSSFAQKSVMARLVNSSELISRI